MDAANPEQLTAFGRFMGEWKQIIAAVDRNQQLGYKYSEAKTLCLLPNKSKKKSPTATVCVVIKNGTRAFPKAKSPNAAASADLRSGPRPIKPRARTDGATSSHAGKNGETNLPPSKRDLLNDWVLPAFGLIAIACIWYVVVTASGGRIW